MLVDIQTVYFAQDIGFYTGIAAPAPLAHQAAQGHDDVLDFQTNGCGGPAEKGHLLGPE